MSFHEPVRYPHGLVDTKEHEEKCDEQLYTQVVAQLLDKQLAIRGLEVRELESTGEEKSAEGANLCRVVKLKGAREKLDLVLMTLEGRRCR